MQAVAIGDRAALAELCTRHERPLYRFLVRAAGESDAEDLFQETWIRVARAARSFDAGRRFSTWLFQIALNLSRDRQRRSRTVAVPPETLDAVDPEAAGRAPVAPDVEARLDLESLLGALPEAQRDVVVLRLLAGVSEEETAEILGCPRGTVKSRLHHALVRLGTLARAGEEASR